MTAYPPWTPPARPGLVPLHPMSFGMLLGRSFAALRQNPRVLLGFAVAVQAAAFLGIVAAVGGATFWAAARLQNVPPDSSDYATIRAGSVAVVIIAGVVLGLCASALTVVVQAVVVTDVARATVAERVGLGGLWRQVRPVAGRLVGYTLLVAAAAVAVVAAVAAVAVGVGTVSPAAAVASTAAAALGAIVLLLWLSTKLLLVAPTIILEHAGIRAAAARSWRLTRFRFWPVLGVSVIVQLIFGAVAETITVPFALLGGMLGAVIAPTGDPGTLSAVTVVVGVVLPEAVALLVQSVGSVVQASAGALLYIDCRMRHEGLHLDLLGYVQARDRGAAAPADPYLLGVGRVVAPRPPAAGAFLPPAAAPAPAAVPPAGALPPGATVPAAPPAAPPLSPTTWTPPGAAPDPAAGAPRHGPTP